MRLVLILVAGLLVACTASEDTATTADDAEKRAHEQMETAADDVQEEVHTALDKAENVEVVLDEAAQDRRDAVDDATEG